MKELLSSHSSFHSSFHAVVNRLVKNCHKEICVVHCNAHGRFDPEGLKWREEQKKGQIWHAGRKHTSPQALQHVIKGKGRGELHVKMELPPGKMVYGFTISHMDVTPGTCSKRWRGFFHQQGLKISVTVFCAVPVLL